MIHSRRDFRITNVDFKGFGSNPANVGELKRNNRYRFVEGDIADYTFVRKILKNARIVVNFAAETHVDRSIANPAPFFESNTKGAFNLLRAAYERNVDKLVHISTDEIYGAIDSGSFDERSPANPSSPYSATKAAADLMAQAWNVTYKLPVIVLRCTNNFGPRQHPEKLIPKTIIRAMKGKEIPLYGGGGQIRDYNISAGNESTNKAVVERLMELLGGPNVRLVYVEDRPGHDFRYSLNSNKARQSLGWKPSHSFDEGLALTVKWYRENVSWWKPLATKKVLAETPWKERW